MGGGRKGPPVAPPPPPMGGAKGPVAPTAGASAPTPATAGVSYVYNHTVAAAACASKIKPEGGARADAPDPLPVRPMLLCRMLDAGDGLAFNDKAQAQETCMLHSIRVFAQAFSAAAIQADIAGRKAGSGARKGAGGMKPKLDVAAKAKAKKAGKDLAATYKKKMADKMAVDNKMTKEEVATANAAKAKKKKAWKAKKKKTFKGKMKLTGIDLTKTDTATKNAKVAFEEATAAELNLTEEDAITFTYTKVAARRRLLAVGTTVSYEITVAEDTAVALEAKLTEDPEGTAIMAMSAALSTDFPETVSAAVVSGAGGAAGAGGAGGPLTGPFVEGVEAEEFKTATNPDLSCVSSSEPSRTNAQLLANVGPGFAGVAEGVRAACGSLDLEGCFFQDIDRTDLNKKLEDIKSRWAPIAAKLDRGEYMRFAFAKTLDISKSMRLMVQAVIKGLVMPGETKQPEKEKNLRKQMVYMYDAFVRLASLDTSTRLKNATGSTKMHGERSLECPRELKDAIAEVGKKKYSKGPWKYLLRLFNVDARVDASYDAKKGQPKVESANNFRSEDVGISSTSVMGGANTTHKMVRLDFLPHREVREREKQKGVRDEKRKRTAEGHVHV